MPQKITLAWRGGTVGIENNRVAIRQAENVVYVELEQADAFLVDVEAAFHNLPKPEPTSGYGGTILPLKPNPNGPKSMQAIVDEIENIVQPHVS